jgi:hypothetical protein
MAFAQLDKCLGVAAPGGGHQHFVCYFIRVQQHVVVGVAFNRRKNHGVVSSVEECAEFESFAGLCVC